MHIEEAKRLLWKAHCNLDDPRKAIDETLQEVYNSLAAQIMETILQDMIDTFEDVHRYGDTYEVAEFLQEYIDENKIRGLDLTKLEK